MRYFVVSLDGQKYGPADIPTLQQWIGEGRVLPNTYLEEEIGGARLQAGGVRDLRFSPEAPPAMTPPPATTGYASVYSNPQNTDLSQNPYADGSYATYQDANTPSGSYGGPMGYSTAARQSLNNAWVLGAIAISVMTVGFCCMVGPIAGGVLAFFGMSAGKKARDLGHPNGQASFIFNVVVLVLSIGLLILSIVFYSAGTLNTSQPL